MIKKIDQNDSVFKNNRMIQDTTKQPIPIPAIIAPPKTRPEIFEFSEILTNLKTKAINSTNDSDPKSGISFLLFIMNSGVIAVFLHNNGSDKLKL